MKILNNDHPDDHRLIGLIQTLRPVPERNAQAAARGRDKFLAELDELIPDQQVLHFSLLAWLFGRKPVTPSGLQPRPAFRSILVAGLVIAFLFGGTGLTVVAAQNSLPGDALYPIKTELEQVQSRFTTGDEQSTELHLAFAQKRLDEIDGLIQEGRYGQVGFTAEEFESHLRLALSTLQSLALKDPGRTSQLSARATSELTNYIQSLNIVLEELPQDIQDHLGQADQNPGDDHNTQAEVGDNNQNLNENESLQANDIPAKNETLILEQAGLEPDQPLKFDFHGKVEAISSQSWTISGIQVSIGPDTELMSLIYISDEVEVQAQWSVGKPIQALHIELQEAISIEGNENNQSDSKKDKDSGEDQPDGNDNNRNENSSDEMNANDVYQPVENTDDNTNSELNDNSIEHENENHNININDHD